MGSEEQNEHRELVGLIANHKWDNVILVGKEFEGISGDYQWFNTSTEAALYVKNNQPQNSALLIKGSRGSRMELMLEGLN